MLHTGKPVEVMLQAIQALDLETVKIRVMDPQVGEGWTREYADGIERAYKTYLSMLAKYPDQAEDILLSKEVDEFWHTHILQTMKYHDDCEAVFGKYLHHEPHIGELTAADIEKREALAEKTRRLYEREFGSEQDYEAAWTGTILADKAALSGVAIRSSGAALSGARIAAPDAALSGARIAAGSAALSGARITGTTAALSGVAIRAEDAALSGARIAAGSAALSGARITGTTAALSGVAIRAEDAALSGARIAAEKAALSGARIATEPKASAAVRAS
jgi:hypothetical protein